MSVILKELEKREMLLMEYDEKTEKLAALRAEEAKLEAELAEHNPETLKAEIEEIKEICIQVGLIEKPAEESEEETPCDNVVEGQPAVASF